jgi:hypothetical protein
MQTQCGVKYRASVTGNMTLSVLDEKGFKIIGIDMLSKGTLRAGTNGALLSKALNDLSLLAQSMSDALEDLPLSFVEGVDISVRPWRCDSSLERKTVSLYDGNDKQIASRKFAKNISEERFCNIRKIIIQAVDTINQTQANLTAGSQDSAC